MFVMLLLLFEGLGVCAPPFCGEVMERQEGGNKHSQSPFNRRKVIRKSVFFIIQCSLLGNYYCSLQKGTIVTTIFFFLEHGDKPRN